MYVCVQAVTSGGSNEIHHSHGSCGLYYWQGREKEKEMKETKIKKKRKRGEEKTWFVLVMVAMIMLSSCHVGYDGAHSHGGHDTIRAMMMMMIIMIIMMMKEDNVDVYYNHDIKKLRLGSC